MEEAKKIKVFPCPHVEIRISVTDQMVKDLKECDEMLTAAVLRDEFDFGPKRVKRFWDRFAFKTACIMSNMATWDDYQKMVKEELGLEITIHDNN